MSMLSLRTLRLRNDVSELQYMDLIISVMIWYGGLGSDF